MHAAAPSVLVKTLGTIVEEMSGSQSSLGDNLIFEVKDQYVFCVDRDSILTLLSAPLCHRYGNIVESSFVRSLAVSVTRPDGSVDDQCPRVRASCATVVCVCLT